MTRRTETLAILPTAFGPLEQSIYSNYQTAQNLSADAYAGYMMSPTPFKAEYNLNYFLVDGWDRNGFVDQYNLVMAPVSKIAATGAPTQRPDYWAVALIMQVEAMDRVTDRFGPIPYSKAGTSLTSVPYDSQQAVYTEFFAQLDTAVASLTTYIAAHPGVKPLGVNDLVYGGDYTKWLKLANSLRLRLAMRIVKADATTAQTQAEKAMADPGGLLSLPSDDALIAQSGGRNNDIWTVTSSYGDNRFNAAMGTYMTGFNDPRLPVYATPATDPTVVDSVGAGKYVGIRIGINIAAKSDYENYASLNTTTNFTQTASQYFFTAAEVWFLKAEAALRGWAGAGTAQTDYETGINTSFQQWGVTDAAYITDATSTEANYHRSQEYPEQCYCAQYHHHQVGPGGFAGSDARTHHHPEMAGDIPRWAGSLGRLSAYGVSAFISRGQQREWRHHRYSDPDPASGLSAERVYRERDCCCSRGVHPAEWSRQWGNASVVGYE